MKFLRDFVSIVGDIVGRISVVDTRYCGRAAEAVDYLLILDDAVFAEVERLVCLRVEYARTLDADLLGALLACE